MSGESKQPQQLPRFVRAKNSAIDNVLPAVSDLIASDDFGNSDAILNYTDLDGSAQKLDYRSLAEHDPMPIPMPVDREGYCSVEFSPQYWATGHGDWLNVCDAIERHMFLDNSDQQLRLFDFGCASGRFLRHAWAFGREKFDCWGSDFAPANVQWVKQHLAGDIKVILNTDVPHLPFSDGYFDVVTAFSVMTHIDLMEDAWLLELRRITNPNGLLYLTIQNEASWEKVISRPGSLEHILKANDVPGNISLTRESFDGPLPQDRFALKMSVEDIYNCNVWCSSDYVNQHWSRYFEILQIANNAHTGFQSPVIMRPLPVKNATPNSSVQQQNA